MLVADGRKGTPGRSPCGWRGNGSRPRLPGLGMSVVATGLAGARWAGRAARLGACLERARQGERSALDQIVCDLNPLSWHVARA